MIEISDCLILNVEAKTKDMLESYSEMLLFGNRVHARMVYSLCLELLLNECDLRLFFIFEIMRVVCSFKGY